MYNIVLLLASQLQQVDFPKDLPEQVFISCLTIHGSVAVVDHIRVDSRYFLASPTDASTPVFGADPDSAQKTAIHSSARVSVLHTAAQTVPVSKWR